MNQALSKKQLAVVAFVLLALIAIALTRYIKAPVQIPADFTTLPLHGTTIASLSINRGSLVPRRLAAKNPMELLATPSPRSTGSDSPGVGRAMTLEEKRKVEEAQEKSLKEHARALAYLKQEGVAVSDEGTTVAAKPDEIPVEVTISLQGTGTLVEGKPDWSTFGYKVEARRPVYLSRTSEQSVQVGFYVASAELGIATPETLAKKQDEALGKALEALVSAWKKDNLESAPRK